MTKADGDRLREIRKELLDMAENYSDSFTKSDILSCAKAINLTLYGSGFSIKVPLYPERL